MAVSKGFRCGRNLPAVRLQRNIRREEAPGCLVQGMTGAGLLQGKRLLLRQRIRRRLGGHGHIDVEPRAPGFGLGDALAQGIHGIVVGSAHLPGGFFHHPGVETAQGGTGQEHQTDEDAQPQDHQGGHPAAGRHQRYSQQRTNQAAALHGDALGVKIGDHLHQLLALRDGAAAGLDHGSNQYSQHSQQSCLEPEGGVPLVRSQGRCQINRDQCRSPGHDPQQAEHCLVCRVPDALPGQEHQSTEQQPHRHQDDGTSLPLGTQPGFPRLGALPASSSGFFGCGFFCARCHETMGLLFFCFRIEKNDPIYPV